MSGGGKGGSQTQATEMAIPGWLEDEARRNIGIARDVSQLGYVPYYGPDVAAFTPMQQAAFEGTNQAAQAFGLPQGQGGMMQPETYAGGVQGHSSGGLYNQSLAELQRQAPGQYQYMQSMFIDPVTGRPGDGIGGGQGGMAQPEQTTAAQDALGPVFGGLPPIAERK